MKYGSVWAIFASASLANISLGLQEINSLLICLWAYGPASRTHVLGNKECVSFEGALRARIESYRLRTGLKEAQLRHTIDMALEHSANRYLVL